MSNDTAVKATAKRWADMQRTADIITSNVPLPCTPGDVCTYSAGGTASGVPLEGGGVRVIVVRLTNGGWRITAFDLGEDAHEDASAPGTCPPSSSRHMADLFRPRFAAHRGSGATIKGVRRAIRALVVAILAQRAEYQSYS